MRLNCSVQSGVMAGQPKETAWLKANKKAIESPRNQRKKRSKQSLQRRVKRALQRVGSRHSDRARRNRNKRLASAGRFIWRIQLSDVAYKIVLNDCVPQAC